MTQSAIADAQGRRWSHYFAFDVPWVGVIDIEVNGLTRGDSFFDASHRPGNAYVELWAGPVWVLLERDASIRFKHSYLAGWALAALAAAGWTEGRLWHLPFLS